MGEHSSKWIGKHVTARVAGKDFSVQGVVVGVSPSLRVATGPGRNLIICESILEEVPAPAVSCLNCGQFSEDSLCKPCAERTLAKKDIHFAKVNDISESVKLLSKAAAKCDWSKQEEAILKHMYGYEASSKELLAAAKQLLANAQDLGECDDEGTGKMYADWQALSDAIDKCEGKS